MVRGWLVHERCGGKQGRCGTRGSRVSAPRFARGKGQGEAAGPENQLGARGYAAAVAMRTGFRDVFTCAWPIISYTVSGLSVVSGSESAGSIGDSGTRAGAELKRILSFSVFCRDKNITVEQLLVDQVKQSVSSAGERKTVSK